MEDVMKEFEITDKELKNITGGVMVVDVVFPGGHQTIYAKNLDKYKAALEQRGTIGKYTFSEPKELNK